MKYLKLFEDFTNKEAKEFIDFYHEVSDKQERPDGYGVQFVKDMKTFYSIYGLVFLIGEFVKVYNSNKDSSDRWSRWSSDYELSDLIDDKILVSDDFITINGVKYDIINDAIPNWDDFFRSSKWLSLMFSYLNNEEDIKNTLNSIVKRLSEMSSYNAYIKTDMKKIHDNVKKMFKNLFENSGNIHTVIFKEIMIHAANYTINYFKSEAPHSLLSSY